MASALAEPASAPSGGIWGLRGAAIALVGAFAGFFIGAQIMFGLAHSLYDRDQLAFGIISEQFLAISVAGIALYFAYFRYRVGASGLGFRFPGWRPLLGAIAVIPLIYVGVLLIIGVFSFVFPHFLRGNADQELLPNGQHVGLGEQIITYVWASIEAPLVEEALFRGLIYQGLRNYFSRWLTAVGSIAAAAGVSGLTFGLAHFEPNTLPILAFVGVVLALVFQYARSIYASFLVHGIFNFIAVYSVFH